VVPHKSEKTTLVFSLFLLVALVPQKREDENLSLFCFKELLSSRWLSGVFLLGSLTTKRKTTTLQYSANKNDLIIFTFFEKKKNYDEDCCT